MADPAWCPPGVPTVNCLIDPCYMYECPHGKVCVASYCGGCHATCVPREKMGEAGVRGLELCKGRRV